MRLSALGLLILGVLAALAASYLVTTLRGGRAAEAAGPGPGGAPVAPRPAQEGEAGAPVAVATRDLTAPVVVESDAVEVRRVPEDEVPAGALSRRADVVGRLLVRSVAAGATFTPDLFAAPGSGARVAAGLRPGMRAVGLETDGGMLALLEPGSVVDVLATVPVGGTPVSMTLFQNVVVLAVGGATLGSDAPREGTSGAVLLLDSKQAETLLLVANEGSVTLALRNPADDLAVTGEGTRLSELVSAPQRRPTPGPVARRPEPKDREVVVQKGGQRVVKTVPKQKPGDGE